MPRNIEGNNKHARTQHVGKYGWYDPKLYSEELPHRDLRLFRSNEMESVPFLS